MKILNTSLILLYGQSMILLMTAYTVCQDKIINIYKIPSFILVEIFIYTIIFITSSAVIRHKKYDQKGNLYMFILSGFLDFIYCFATNNSFLDLNVSIIVFVEQLIYPLALIADKIIKKASLNTLKLLSYIGLIAAYFYYNILNEEGQLKMSAVGLCYIFAANFFDLSSSYIQVMITKKCHFFVYLKYSSFWSMVFRLMYIVGYLYIDKRNILTLTIFTEKLSLIALYIVLFAVYYFLSLYYINKYHCSSYYAHTITSNLYLLALYNYKDLVVMKTFVWLISFLIALIFIWIEIPRKRLN